MSKRLRIYNPVTGTTYSLRPRSADKTDEEPFLDLDPESRVSRWDYSLIAQETPQLRVFRAASSMNEFTAKDFLVLGVPEPTVYRILGKMLRAGMIVKVRKKRWGKTGPHIQVYRKTDKRGLED